MAVDFLFETDRFNLSDVKPHFINPCCFGEDLAAWLRDRLAERGIVAHQPDQEDWGWYTGTSYRGIHYFIAIGGNADESRPGSNWGEWRVSVDKVRSLWARLRGQHPMTRDDALGGIVRQILEDEPSFTGLRTEDERTG